MINVEKLLFVQDCIATVNSVEEAVDAGSYPLRETSTLVYSSSSAIVENHSPFIPSKHCLGR